jgi:hypothetical protein
VLENNLNMNNETQKRIKTMLPLLNEKQRRITVPTAKAVVDFHHQVIAHAGAHQ